MTLVATAQALPASAVASPEPHHTAQQFITKTWGLVVEHWFIIGVGVAIGVAAAVPDLGKNDG